MESGAARMSQHRYPMATLYADYGRVAFGLAATLGPLLLLDLARPVAMLLAALAALAARRRGAAT